MSQTKTIPTAADVTAFIDAIDNDEKRRDCHTLNTLMQTITGKPPVLWGPSIVGFDSYHYRYDSGREGDMAVTGFSPRKADISVYLFASDNQPALLARLGRHRMGASCLSIRKLADVDLDVLEQLIRESVMETKRRYGTTGTGNT